MELTAKNRKMFSELDEFLSLLSVEERNAIPEDFGIMPEYEGIPYDLIVDGKVMKDNLQKIGKNNEWLRRQVEKFNLSPNEVFIATIDGKGQFYCQKKEK